MILMLHLIILMLHVIEIVLIGGYIQLVDNLPKVLILCSTFVNKLKAICTHSFFEAIM